MDRRQGMGGASDGRVTLLLRSALVYCSICSCVGWSEFRKEPPFWWCRLSGENSRGKVQNVCGDSSGKCRMSVDIARQESILERQIKPAALRAGIGKIGWHTYRHSHSSLLRRVGADIKVQQELLRHSTIQSRMSIRKPCQRASVQPTV